MTQAEEVSKAVYHVVQFGDRTWQVAGPDGLLCGWHRLTREQAEAEAERKSSMLGIYEHPATIYICRHCGGEAGYDPEMCPNCGPLCAACHAAKTYPCQVTETPSDTERIEALVRDANRARLLATADIRQQLADALRQLGAATGALEARDAEIARLTALCLDLLNLINEETR